MGPFAEKYRSSFSAAVRMRGDDLVDEVTLVAEAGPPWKGFVQGTHSYTVVVDGPRVGCTCAAFASWGPCKHLWALILAVDEMLGELGASAAAGGPEGPVSEGRGHAVMRGDLDRQIALQYGRRRLEAIRARHDELAPPELFRVADQLHHFVHPSRCRDGDVVLSMGRRQRLANGAWSTPKMFQPWDVDRGHFADALDRQLLHRIESDFEFGDFGVGDYPGLKVDAAEAGEILQRLAAEGRLFLCERPSIAGAKADDLPAVVPALDVTLPVEIEVTRGGSEREIVVEARLAGVVGGGDAEAAAHEGTEPFRCMVGVDGAIVGERLVRLRTPADTALVAGLLAEGPLLVDAEMRPLVEELLGQAPPEPFAIAGCQARFIDGVTLEGRGPAVTVDLVFEYCDPASADGEARVEVRAADLEAAVVLGGRRGTRDRAAERGWIEWAIDAGAVCRADTAATFLEIPGRRVVDFIGACLDRDVAVLVEGKRIRSMATPSMRVESGIDWFDVRVGPGAGGGEVAELPEILRAIRNNQRFVQLRSGDLAMLGGAAIDELAQLAQVGKVEGDRIRFGANQGFLLDAMLAARREEVSGDAAFEELRQRCRGGLKPLPKRAPKGFGATLRPYQEVGLGWFRFLGELGVGGCLADDMGLGKTVQVLALLEQQRRRRPHPGPSLVVAPRSLVFHWQREAERFAPKLRVVVFVGAGRFEQHEELVENGFQGVDLVLTTYGTWRNDVQRFDEVRFHYAILDEAQAIKNERSQVSKAVRLCRATHRLALSGTPVENHLGELWSLFEFLNPGMLGAAKAFRDLVRSSAKVDPAAALAVDPDSENGAEGARHEADAGFLQALRTAVRPFLLRRTKEQVLTDLPDKTVQVIDCELPKPQRKAYDELAAHYRKALLGELDEELLQEQRFQVLEALLRLRQAACHPGLLDEKRVAEGCAKFEALMPMLEELREEGHKALVFSQFPSFLKLLRRELDERGIAHAYLDGQTRKRREVVDRFQTDPDCGVFLISIKAGGHGLNLVAASYVFLLDPWWNPAVEAQAIDRVHRIGQKQHVHAFRLICRDTVEQRVAELQQQKRRVAEAVLGDDSSILQDLTAADVAALLAPR